MAIVISLKVDSTQGRLSMKLVMLKNALIISEVKLLPRLRIDAVSSGSVLQIIYPDMNRTGEIQNFKWVYLEQNLIRKLDKCQLSSRLGICRPLLCRISNVLLRILERFLVSRRQKPYKAVISLA